MKKKEIIKIEQVEEKILILRGVRVIIDADVAALYGVETREVNQAVKNNPKKFPKGYVFTTTDEDLEDIKNFDILKKIKYFKSKPKVFTEKGLYMLATILKSDTATDTTINIISDIIGDNLETSETVSEFELNFAVVKLRHKVKRKKQ